jgi:hypothetical protein
MMHITNRANGITVDSCRFLMDSTTRNTATGTTAPLVGVAITSSATDVSTSGNAAQNVSITNSYFSGGTHGVAGAGTTFSTTNPTGTAIGFNNVTINSNVFRNQTVTGVRVNNFYGGSISRNLITRPTRLPASTAATTAHGIQILGTNDSLSIDNNVINRLYPTTNTGTTTVFGINVGGDAYRPTRPLRIFNNAISRFTSRGLQSGITTTSCDNVFILHNTIALIDSSAPSTATTQTQGTPASGPRPKAMTKMSAKTISGTVRQNSSTRLTVQRSGSERTSVMLRTPLNGDEDLRAFGRAYERKDARPHVLAELLRRLLQGLVIFNI